MVIYIFTKFGADWLIFVDAKSVNKKIVDRRWMITIAQWTLRAQVS